MLGRGFEVTATDGSVRLAAIAQARIRQPVTVMRFEQLEAHARYDAVWANASLHHAPLEALPGILARIHRALKPGGLFEAGFKSGQGPGRDGLGRYYSFPTAATLQAAYAAAGAWSACEIAESVGRGYDNVERPWLHVRARKAALG